MRFPAVLKQEACQDVSCDHFKSLVFGTQVRIGLLLMPRQDGVCFSKCGFALTPQPGVRREANLLSGQGPVGVEK